MSAYPPFKTEPGLPVTPEIALTFLTQYLNALKESPHLLPNARLEASGPTAGSSSSSITIHNLQRVEAGLRGEFLAPQLDLKEGNVKVTKGMDDGVNTADGEGEGEGWMDLQEYQREQSVDGPEAAQEDLGVEDGNMVEEDNHVEEEDSEMPAAKKVKLKHESSENKKFEKKLDPQARKIEKKARMKAEKMAKEEQRKAAQKAS